MDWNFACPDWKERLKEGRSLVPELPLFEARRLRAIKTFNKMRLPDVPGQPTMADAAGDWFRDIVGALFGSVDDLGVRHVPEIFTLVGKKNSKTTGSAAIMLTALLLNERPRAPFFLVGPTQAVADVSYQSAVGMIEADPEGFLQKQFHIRDHKKEIVARKTSARLLVKTFDNKIIVGSKPIGVLLDELHEMADFKYASRVLAQLRGGMVPFPESFFCMITTMPDKPPAGVMKAELNYARRVRDGLEPSGRLLPILYEFPEEFQRAPNKPYLDPACWHQVNPNMGRSITLERLVENFKAEQAKGQEQADIWCTQHLNIQMGVATHDDRWTGVDYWEGAVEPGLTLDAMLERCEVLVVGIDGGGADDLLGVCVAGRERETGRWLYWYHAWVDRKLLSLRPEIAETLTDFANDGDLTLVDFETPDLDKLADYMPPDVADVVALVKRLDDTGLLPEENAVGADRAGTVMTMLVDELDKIGITNGENGTKRRIAAIPQGGWLNAAIEGQSRKLRDGTARHCGQPMMAWCAGNARVEMKGHAVSITKQTAGKAKIDPLAAGFNATMLLARNPNGQSTSFTAADLLTVF